MIKRSSEDIQFVIERYATDIVRLSFTYVKNVCDAEDIAQEVFLVYMLKKPVFNNEQHEKAWLIRAAINKSKDYLKSAWRKKRGPMPCDLPDMPREQSELLEVVLQLDDKYRLPIYLYYFDDYPIKAIARLLKTNASTVSTRLSRGRDLIKKQLGARQYE